MNILLSVFILLAGLALGMLLQGARARRLYREAEAIREDAAELRHVHARIMRELWGENADRADTVQDICLAESWIACRLGEQPLAEAATARSLSRLFRLARITRHGATDEAREASERWYDATFIKMKVAALDAQERGNQ